MSNVVVERRDGVVRVTLNRPDRKNAVTVDMWVEMTDVFRAVAATPSDRVLVVTGAGDAFCAGADLLDKGIGRTAGARLEALRNVGRCAQALHEVPKPTVAAVNGAAVGAGCNLALGCDLVVASDAARFSEIFVQRGLSIDFGGSWLLPRLVGLHKAKELALLAETLTAEEAAAAGLVNRVVPAAQLDAAIDEIVGRLLRMAPIALAQTKKLLDQSFAMSFADAVNAEGDAQVVNSMSTDVAEAVRAFMEKREPQFTGE
jgi:enoyl-CoA hydratase/carnithine racemase